MQAAAQRCPGQQAVQASQCTLNRRPARVGRIANRANREALCKNPNRELPVNIARYPWYIGDSQRL